MQAVGQGPSSWSVFRGAMSIWGTTYGCNQQERTPAGDVERWLLAAIAI